MDEYRAQRRAKRIAWNILLVSIVALALMGAGVALHREQLLQTMEKGR